MKNKQIKFLYRVVLVILLLVAFFPMRSVFAYSEVLSNTENSATSSHSPIVSRSVGSSQTTDHIIDNNQTGIEDSTLYSILLNRYNSFAIVHSLEEKVKLTTRIFCEIGFDKLDLKDSSLTTLEGLQKLEFDELVHLDVSYNKLTEITASQVYRLSASLQVLNASNNNISSVKLGGLTNLHTLLLNNNVLSQLDVSTLLGHNDEDVAYINLSQNLFSSATDLVLPDVSSYSHLLVVDAINNNITDAEQTEVVDKLQVNLAVQGLVQAYVSSFSTSSSVVFYPTSIVGLEVEIKNTASGEVVVFDGSEQSFVDVVSVVGMGSFSLRYLIDGDVVYNENSYLYSFYAPMVFSVLPSKPTYDFEIEGKIYQPHEVGKLEQVATVRFFAADEGAKIFYSRAVNGEWVEASDFKLTQGGKTYIYVKSVVNGMESEVTVVTINARPNLYLSNVVLMVIVLGVLFLFLFGLIPVIRKYILEA